MEASVGPVLIANTMEVDVVSKHLNKQIGRVSNHVGLHGLGHADVTQQTLSLC